MQRDRLPVVLRKREPVVDIDDMGGVYDSARDLWVDESGTPLIATLRPRPTTISETREGIDQTEHHEMLKTRFGETMQTATREGIDQREHAEPTVGALWGKTLITKTREGIDSSEG